MIKCAGSDRKRYSQCAEFIRGSTVIKRLVLFFSLIWFGVIEGSAAEKTTIPPILSVLMAEQADNSPYAGMAIKVVAGGNSSCALLSDGRVICWGNNEFGYLGTGDSKSSTVPRAVLGISSAIDVATSARGVCALLESGKILCWGSNFSGQLGNEQANNPSFRPVPVKNIDSAIQISGGFLYFCATLSNGSVDCWGLHPQVTEGSATPVVVQGLVDVTQIAAGSDNACGLLTDQTVKCWGANGSGVLGDGTNTDSIEPVSVLNVAGATSISVSQTACAVSTTVGVYCWGRNNHGQLGNDTVCAGCSNSIPTLVSESVGAVQVSNSITHSCMVLNGGGAKCWGRNVRGTLGDGTTNRSLIPVAPVGLPPATQISAGPDHTCAVTTEGAVYCWGLNSQGRLGTNDRVDSLVPRRVFGF